MAVDDRYEVEVDNRGEVEVVSVMDGFERRGGEGIVEDQERFSERGLY